MIHVCQPYRVDKNLGKAYNDAFKLIGDNDWLCITDYDILLLLPETIAHLHGYVEHFPDTGIFTCAANRSHINSINQLLPTGVSDDDRVTTHIAIAKAQTKKLYQVTELNKHISGFLMMISKKTWNNVKFPEDMRCLGVDNVYSNRILQAGLKILRMDGVYVFHTYRLDKNVKDINHLL